MELRGKVVVITGASSGIGRATARLLAARGAELVLAGRSSERLGWLAAELGDALAVPGDLTSEEAPQELVDAAVGRFGRLDVLFANAGIYLAGPVAEGDPRQFQRLVDTNLTSVLRLVHAALAPMLAAGTGDVVITSSISGHQAIPWEPVYGASKHALQAFAHGLRRQLRQRGVRVTSIAPGKVLNELWGVPEGAPLEEELAAGSGLRSEDVAEAVLFALTRPRHATVRDLVLLPSGQDL